MGTCTICGKSAGWFSSLHDECATKREEGWKSIVEAVENRLTRNDGIGLTKQKLHDLSLRHSMSEEGMREAVLQGWDNSISKLLEDGLLTVEEEGRLVQFIQDLGLQNKDLDKNGTYSRVVEAGALRDILEGKIPERQKLGVSLPFRFHKNEKLVWVYTDVKYLEDRTKIHHEGRSQGISIRIMSGVYYRLGAYKGHPVEVTNRVHVDTGMMAITTKHIYFAGPTKSLRIRLNDIVSLTPFSDAIGIHRSAISAKPQVFVTGNGWFLHNVLSNIDQLSES